MSERAKLWATVTIETTFNGKFVLRGSEITSWDTFDEVVTALRGALCEPEKPDDLRNVGEE